MIATLILGALLALTPVDPEQIARRFYEEVRTHQTAAALADGKRYLELRPTADAFALDYAYLLLSAKRTGEAATLLKRLTRSRDPKIARAASAQLATQSTLSGSPNAPKVVLAPSPEPSVTVAPESAADRGYRELAAGDRPAAVMSFRAYLADHPQAAGVWADIAYAYEALGRRAEAVDAFASYLALKPLDDEVRLQRGYDLDAIGRKSEATAVFAGLSGSSNPTVAKAARAEVAARRVAPQARFEAYGYAQNEPRFRDSFYGVDARYVLAETKTQPYLALHFSGDTRSGAPGTPAIFADNAAVFDVGVRRPIARGTFVFAEAGAGIGLRGQGTITDLRYGVLSSASLGRGAAKTQIDASVAYYSRFNADVIGYLNLAHEIPVARSLRLIVGGNLALDAHRDYGNNYAEGVLGVAVGNPNFTIRVLGVSGTYLSRGISLPTQRTYSEIRPELIFGFSR